MNKHKAISVVTKSEPSHPFPIKEIQADSEAHAVTIAKDWAIKYPAEYVYIYHTRKDNGQQGYINPNGYSTTGYDWASEYKEQE